MSALFCAHGEYLRHLEAEIVWLKLQMIHERQRAEFALDKLQMLHVGGGPVTVPTPDERRAEATITDLLSNPEFVNAGGIEGAE